MMMNYFFLLLLKFTIEENIIFAWQMNRHGARGTSVNKMGKDILDEDWVGSGELTSVGKRMLYLLGVKMRKRYQDLLSNEYNPQEIYITSTDINRTIESIESYLQGFYPKKTGPQIQNNILSDKRVFPPNELYVEKFKDILNKYNLNEDALPNQMSIEPVHIISPNTFSGYILNNCKHHGKNTQEFIEKYVNFKKKFEKFDKILPIFKEIPNNETTKILSYLSIYSDCLICDFTDSRNLAGKYGLDEEEFEELKNLTYEFFNLIYAGEEYYNIDRDASIVFASAELDNIKSYMKNAKEKYEKGKNYIKFVIYSGHDSTIGFMDKFFKYAFNTKLAYPSFASSRHLELYIDDKKEYKVRYLNGNDETIFDNYPYDKFVKDIDEKIWSKKKIWDFCGFEYKDEVTDVVTDPATNSVPKNEEGVKVLKIIWIPILVVNIVLIILLVIIFFKYLR